MSVYLLAKTIMRQATEQASAAGYGEQDLARAMMSEVIAAYKRERSNQDIAHELNFLAENLDEDAEYAFMRP